MSYTVHPYLIDIEELRRIYGSHDEDLVSQIEKKFAEDIQFYNEEATAIFGETTITINQALHELMDGRCSQSDVWQYGYALELICQHIATPLPNDLFEALHGHGLAVIAAIKPIADLVLTSIPPIPIPLLGTNGIQHIGHMTHPTAHKQFTQKPSLLLSDDDEDATWKLDLYHQYYSWLEAAVQQKKGIITFL